jgi:hypothetical protein
MASDILESQKNRIGSLDTVAKWLVAIGSVIVAISIGYFRLRSDVDAHHSLLIDHASALRDLERSDIIKTEKLTAILERLDEIKRLVNKP